MENIRTLTPRQIEILSLYASGMSGKEIAGTLFLSIHTVRNYLKAIKKKTGATNLSQIIAWCVHLGTLLVDSETGLVKPGKENV